MLANAWLAIILDSSSFSAIIHVPGDVAMHIVAAGRGHYLSYPKRRYLWSLLISLVISNVEQVPVVYILCIENTPWGPFRRISNTTAAFFSLILDVIHRHNHHGIRERGCYASARGKVEHPNRHR